ncbi:hypothetical protein MMC21_005209 [Puttea exsequens]|nr:hypothetical protein [Puttea exsequens]
MIGNNLPFLKANSKARAGLQTGPAVTVTSEPYQYTRLEANQVRVLSISVEPATGFLVCDFDVRDLTSGQGTYRAISYCWGDHTPTNRVLCSDGNSLLVTESATEILRFIVPRNPMDFFWIDQLCVNQADLVEKSAQVMAMGQIYSFTRQVIAWMGRGNRSSESAIAFVEMLFGEMEDMESKGLQPTLAPLMSLPARVHNAPAQMQASYKWSALSHLLRNPWFERIWVMQEVIMACAQTSRTSCVGSHILLSFEKCTVDFNVLAGVLRMLENDYLHSNLVYDRQNKDGLDELGIYPPGFDAIKTFSTFRELRSRGTPVLLNSALSHAWHFKASDDRDKVYAVMAFADEVADASLRPDYTSTAEDVYTVWTKALLERDDDYPMLLHMAGIGLQRSLSKLPSWVPDFSCGSSEVQLASEMTKSIKGRHYLASGVNHKIEIKVDLSSLKLQFQGIRVDTIGVVFRQPSSEKSDRWYHILKPSRFFTPDKKFHRSFLQWLDDIEHFLSNPSPSLNSNQPQPREILWQTIVGDYPTGEAPIESNLSEAFECWYQAQRELAGKNRSSLLDSISRRPDVYDQAQTFEDLKAASLHDRPVFGTTQKRLLGHGSKGLLPGDTVCIVKGALTPFLLRPVMDNMEDAGNDSQPWRLVGGCFVHGLMYGEGLEMGELEEFIIT